MESYWFLFHNEKLLLQKDETGCSIPYGEKEPAPTGNHSFRMGEWESVPCRASEMSDQAYTESEVDLSESRYQWVSLRESYELIPHQAYRIAGKASELLYWDRNSRFCPTCGTALKFNSRISKCCPHCEKEFFPHVSPAILVLIHRGEEALLVHARTFQKPFYGLVAGFVETGETLEECVRREVREETTLEITNIRYFGSQEWPYPSQLMIGFEADYQSGDLYFADHELTEGAFYRRDALPTLPQKLSLARKMIDAWIESSR